MSPPELVVNPWRTNRIDRGFEAVAPVWGHDYVFNGEAWVICDVNFAPGIRGLGLHEVQDAATTARDIRAWFEKYQRSPNWCTNWEHELELLKARIA